MKLKLEDIYRLRLVGDPRISPDGTVAFVVGRMNKKKNDYLTSIYIYDKKVRKFTSGTKDSSPRFTADSRGMVYLRKKDKKVEIRYLPLEGGESRLIAEGEKISNLQVDDNYVYFLAPDIKKEKDDVMRVESIPFYFNGKGYIYNARMHLHRVPIRGGKAEKITSGDFEVTTYHVLNGRVIYAATFDETRPFFQKLYQWKDGESILLLQEAFNIQSITISPDERRVALFLKTMKNGFAEHSKLYFLNLEEGKLEKACPSFPLSLGNSLNSDVRISPGRMVKWLSSDSLLFVVTEGGTAPVYLYRDGECTRYLSGKRSVEGFDYGNGTLVFAAQSALQPSEIYVLKNGREKQVTDFNRFLKNREVREVEHFRFTASDGVPIDGWLLPGEGDKWPAVLEIHGGPKTAYGHAFMFEFHYLNSLGFAVIFMNPRGSAGYSEDFATQIRGHYGDRDYRDIMEGVDYVLKNYPVDEHNLFVTGGSYGGFMTNWIVGHTSRFRAAATQRSISNQISFWGTSDIGPWFGEDQIGLGKDLWDAFEDYWTQSPLKYAKNINTPLLIIHSLEDYRCPVEQAYQLFYALRMQKKETRMVLFPEENHDLSRNGKPLHRVTRLNEIAQWFLKHKK